jgi:hypothetical protein
MNAPTLPLEGEPVDLEKIVSKCKALVPVESGPDDFDWHDDDSVVLRHQPAVAIYRNNAGGVTIRQERSWDQDEDVTIYIDRDNIPAFIDKLTDICGIPSAGRRR